MENNGASRAEIMIVDDERLVRAGIAGLLEGEGYAVRQARDGNEALALFREHPCDLALLDVMMPGRNGYATCADLRHLSPQLPILFLTAKDTDLAEVRGFGAGADDFIPKSASEAVLLARIARAIARSREAGFASVVSSLAGIVRLGSVSVDLTTLEVSDGQGRGLARLTRTEAEILRLLERARGRTLSLETLIGELRGEGFACEDTMAYVHIHNLRAKLGPESERIVNQRGSGYRLLV